MLQKDYYRLEELEKRYGIYKSDISYMVEQSKLRLFWLLYNEPVLVGNSVDGSIFVGHGTATYTGLVCLSDTELLKLVHKGKISTQWVWLLNQSGITNYSVNYDLQSPIPNRVVKKWERLEVQKLPKTLITAQAYPTEEKNSAKILADSFSRLPSKLQPKLDLSKYKNMPEYSIKQSFFEFEIEKACILHADLPVLGIVVEEESEKPVEIEPNNFKDQFDELLATILVKNKSLQNKQIHRILCEETDREEDSRHYDHRNILLENVEGVIIWNDIYSKQAEKRCTSKTIDNRLSEVRKIVSSLKINT